MRIVAISPVPSHPQRQGNSGRIHTLLRHLQARGHVVHFIYYTMEGLEPAQGEAMAGQWDALTVVPCTQAQRPAPPAEGWGIDDWYHDELGQAVAALHRSWVFDVALVNYVWMSGALDALPDTVVKLIDTHDVFSNRDLLFTAQGLAPAWYYTRPAEEARGLTRAHHVLAIQTDEAAVLRGLIGAAPVSVSVIGHLLPALSVAPPVKARPLRLGYLGSANPLNVRGLNDLWTALACRPEVAEQVQLVLAGPLAQHTPAEPLPHVLRLGPVDRLADFYAQVDLCVNPMPEGTGLKIKTLEALSYGHALLGTASAWSGLDCPDPLLCQPNATTLPDALAALLDSASLARVRQACQQCFQDYARREHTALDDLLHGLQHRRATTSMP